MVSQELLNFIRQQKEAGVDHNSIRQSLINNGWDTSDIDAALAGFVGGHERPINQVPSPAPMSRDEATSEIKKLGKFKASKLLFVQSLNLLKKDKEIVLFPIISAIVSFFTLALFGGFLWQSGIFNLKGEEVAVTSNGQFYGILFAFYISTFFLTTYFRVGLTAVVYERINGRDIDFKEGLSRATKISGKIFVWSLLAGTVGVLLKIVADKSKWLGKLVAALLGSVWNLATFFIAPTLLLDNVSVWQSVKNSGNTFRKTWGETLITNVSLGLFSFLAVLLTLVVYVILGVLFIKAGFSTISLIVICFLCVLTLIMISVISTCLSEIFKVALYSYARFGLIAEGFSPELIIGAVKEEKEK